MKVAALLLALIACAGSAFAQDYPTKPIQIIVGFAPGGGSDIQARLIAVPLGKILGQNVIVRNVTGAGGQLAANTTLREGMDGHAILSLNHPDLYMTVTRLNAPYKTTDFQIIMVDVKDPRVMLVTKGSDINSLADFAARAKAQPGKLSISVAQGGAQELFAKWLVGRLGLDVTVVGYKGGSEASNALLGGEVTANLGDDFARMNLRDRTKALLVASKDKSPRWSEAPTLAAALAPLGVSAPSPDFLARYGIYAVPAAFKKTNPAGYRKLQQALLEARRAPEVQEYFAKNNLQDLSVGRAGEEFDAAFNADMAGVEKIK